MAGWGIKTWDKNGRDNNTGLVRILAVGTWVVGSRQQTGSASFNIPSGYVMDFLFQSSQHNAPSERRRVIITGGQITLTPVASDDFTAGTESACSGNYLLYVRAS